MAKSSLALFLLSFRWQDLIDITLNSYIVFRLYILFRGTQTFSVLFSILLLWFFQRIAVSMGLILTSWLLQGVTAFAALIIILVFRDEIRSVFQAKNLKALLWGVPRKVSETPVEIIVESVFEMAKYRCGALIVLPGKKEIKDVIQKGLPWKGEISKEMIKTIFWPDNPVHDGAAVIEGNRISEVGIILPLSQQRDLPSNYGTRHRAALGLSEITDALVIVVSEERGTITVAKDSKLVQVYTNEKLLEVLHSHTGVTTEDPHPQKEPRRTAMALGISFVVVLAVWFSFARGKDILISVEAPIKYMNPNKEMEVIDTSANTVQVHLSGSEALIRSIRPEQVQVTLDLKKAKVGENVIPITNDDLIIPPGIVLNQVNPSEIKITLDKMIKKEVTVQADWIGKLDDQLVISNVEITPDKVWIIGRSVAVNSRSTVYTQPVSLNKIRESGELNADILPDKSFSIYNGSKRTAAIRFSVEKRNK